MRGSVPGPLARRKMFGGSRSRRLVTAGLAATASVVMLAGPVPAMGVTEPGESPCLASTGSLTLSASTVYAGQSVSASFTTQRAHNCEGVLSGVFGPGASVWGGVSGGGGTLTPPNMGVNTYTVTVFFPGGSVDVASESVTVQRWPDSITDPAGMCVDVRGGNSANGTPVQLWTCNGTEAQQWSTPDDGTIRAMGKCLGVAGGGIVRGTAVQLQDCDGSAGQTWGLNNVALVNPVSGLCLDATGASTAAGTPLQIWDCTNADAAQQWTPPQGSDLPLYDPTADNTTVTFQPDNSSGQPVNGSAPSFVCTLEVHDPTIKRLGNPGSLYVTAFGHSNCELPVTFLSMNHVLFRNGFPVNSETDISKDFLNAATEPDKKCAAGQWTSAAQTVLVAPPGYRPKIGLIFVNNRNALTVNPSDCLASTVGTPLKVAEAYIQDQGFTVGTVTMQPSNTAPYDNVLAQNLESDGQTVDLVASEGHDTVPDLRGEREAYAISDIDEDGLILGNHTHRYDCVSPGDVEGQTPDAGTYFDPSNPPTVNITVSDCDGIPK